MAIYEIYSHSELRRYKAHICSKATLINILCVLLTFIPPLFIAYRSEGFWKKISFYEEQPDVDFKHKLICIFHTNDDNFVTWSTFANYNELQTGHLRIPTIKSREEDSNRDGLHDRLHFDLSIPLQNTEKVTGVTLILLFDYKLHKYVGLRMESLGIVQFHSGVAGSSLSVTSDLKLLQTNALRHRGLDLRYGDEIISKTAKDASEFQLFNIITKYTSRNVTTLLTNTYTTWTTGRLRGEAFRLNVIVNYKNQLLYYAPGFWQLIKLAWIQYFCVLIVFIFIVGRIKLFIFQNQLVNTIVQRPWKNSA